MTTETLAPALTSTRTSHSKEMRDAYNIDFCQALSNYVAAGKRFSFVSSGDEQGRLVITFTIEDGPALIDGVSRMLRTGAFSQRGAKLY
jgi:hypothetical protein